MFDIEFVGYIASAFTIISLTCEDIMNLRILNTIGSSMWVYYGIKKNARAVIVANVLVIFIQIYLIYRLLTLDK